MVNVLEDKDSALCSALTRCGSGCSVLVSVSFKVLLNNTDPNYYNHIVQEQPGFCDTLSVEHVRKCHF